MDFIAAACQQFRAQLINEKERQISLVKTQINQDIAPKYNEIDKIKDDSITTITNEFIARKNALTEQYNIQLAALQKKYDQEKSAIENNCINKKSELYNLLLDKATLAISQKFDKVITHFNNIAEEVKE